MKKLLALLMALAMVFCFAACGGNDAPETTTDPVNGEAASDAGAENNDAAKTIVVGYTIYEPMNYKDESGKLVGFDTELAEAVFGNLGYEVIFQEIEWSSKYTDLDSGTIDCVWNGFTCNTADDDGVLRSEKVDFSYNYMENRQVVVVKADAAVETAADLNGKFGVAESGSAGEAYAKGFEGTMFKGFIKQTECLTEIKAGTADFAVVDAQLAKSYVGKGDYADLKVVDALSSDVEYYGIGFKKGSELTAQVNAQLEALGADGTIAALAEKYGVATTAITDFSDQK
ncbi:MAG: transporter substrate-binding domain-containing protein [Clostridia bacterium]|nr:transporter substrate-binding domain-containing protein [Clostridia bacterium]